MTQEQKHSLGLIQHYRNNAQQDRDITLRDAARSWLIKHGHAQHSDFAETQGFFDSIKNLLFGDIEDE